MARMRSAANRIHKELGPSHAPSRYESASASRQKSSRVVFAPNPCAPDPGEEGVPYDPITTGPGGDVPDNGAVFSGEQLTASVEVYNNDCVSHEEDITFDYQCGGEFSSTVNLGDVNAPSFWGPSGLPHSTPGAPVSYSFTINPSLCETPDNGPPPHLFTWYITATPADISNGTAGTSLTPHYSEYIVPPGQITTCACVEDSADESTAQAYRGDPVNTATGAFGQTFTDAVLHTPGYPLQIVRSYSSAATASGPLGPGWTMPWFTSLSVDASTGNVTFNAEYGNQYLFTSNGEGGFEAPIGVRSTLAETTNASGTITGYMLTTVQQDVLTFNAAGQITGQVDPTGRGLSFSYTGGQLTSITDAAGQAISLSYTGDLLTGIALPDGQAISYGYTSGQLASATLPGGTSGETTTYTYNSAGLLATIQNPDGNYTVRNTYNAAGQVTSQQDGTGAVTSFSYATTSAGLSETDTTEPNGGIWTDLYGGNALLETIDPLGDATSYQYNAQIEPIQVTDPMGNVTTMTYDNSGNLQSRTDALGNEQQWTYNASNSVTSFTDAGNNVTLFTYNSMNEITSATTPGGNEITYAYDGAGNLTSSVDPRGNVSGADAVNFTTTYTYNSSGQLATVTNPDGGTTSYTYSAMGLPATTTDPLGRVTTDSYTSAEQLASVTAPNGGVTSYKYDMAGNMTSLTDPDGNTWSYSYDADNRLAAVANPLGNSSIYVYDGDGNQVTFTDARGIVTTTTYDADDHPVKFAYSDGTPTVTYKYDADGHVNSVTDGTGTRSLAYDADGQLTGTSGPGSGGFDYGYNADGNITSRTYPDGTSQSYTYNASGQVASMTSESATTTYSYDAAGNLTSTAMPNGVTESRSYNGNGQLTSITDANGSATLDSYGLTLNADGQPTQATVAQDGTVQPTQYYGYGPGGAQISACYSATGKSACSAASAGTATGTAPDPTTPGAPTGMVTSGIPGMCLDDAQGSTTPGNKVDLYTCTGSANTQQWTIAANGTVQIDGLCLDVKQNGTTNGSLIDLYTCNGGANQQWTTTSAGMGLENPNSGLCLDDPQNSATPGTQLELFTCDQGKGQHWLPPYNGPAYAGELTSGVSTSTTSQCLDDAQGSATPGNKVDLFTCSGSAKTQLWTVQDNGTVQIHGLCLDIKSNGTTSGSLVDLFTCKAAGSNQNQTWAPTPFGYLVNPASGLCLDDPSSTTTTGTQLDIATCSGATGQQWALPSTTVPADPTSLAVTATVGAATLTWTPPASTGGTALTGYTITASPGGATATAGPFATSATISGLTAGTAYTFTITAANADGTDTTAPTSAVTPGNEVTYSYDKAGNLTSSEADGLITTSSYNAGEELTKAVTGSAVTSYGYDADGNQTTVGNDFYGYNGAGELAQATTPAGTFSYEYDSGGNLSSSSVDGSLIQRTIWDANNVMPQAAEETSPAGSTTADYLYNPNSTLASMTTPAGTYQATTDWLRSVTGLVNAAGSQVTSTTYSSYGAASTTGSPAPSIGFAGSYGLPGSIGLDDMRAREYSPSSSDFVSVDPLLAITAQPYGYASDEPEYQTDPNGLIGYGRCLSGTAIFGLQLFASLCDIVTLNISTGEVQLGGTFTLGGGTGTPTVGYLGGPLITNANFIGELGGIFGQVGGSAEGDSIGGGGDFAIGQGPCNKNVWTGFGGLGQSLDLPFIAAGVEAHGGFTNTWTGTIASFNVYRLWDKISSFF